MVKSTKLFFKKNQNWIFSLLLCAVTFAAYYPAWNGLPIWDDDAHITRSDLQSVTGIVHIWTQVGITQQYYPIVHSVFWVEHLLFGDSTLGYHLLNILLHAFSALMFVAILKRLDMHSEVAWFAGWIFALHPVMVESVAWISELKNVLSGIFFFTAILAFLEFDNNRKRKHYIIALILFLLGLLAKSVIVTLPAILLVIFWWKRGKVELQRDVIPLLPFFAIGIISGLFTTWVEHRYIGAWGSEFNLSVIERGLIAGRVIWFYLYKLLWPANLVFSYPRWQIESTAVWQYLFPAGVLFIGTLFWGLRKRSRSPMTALLFFVIALFPALGFVNVYPFCYSFVADHFQYLASIGPITAFATIIMHRTNRQKENSHRVMLIKYLVVLSILFPLSWKQCGMYSNAETLYRTIIEKNPHSWMAHTNLGHLLAEMGKTDEAMAHLEKAVELAPDQGEPHNNLGVLLERLGRTDDAIAQYKMAVEFEPRLAKPHNNLGALLEKIGKTNEAITQYQEAVEQNPNFAEAHYNLGVLLNKAGRKDDVIEHYKKALELNPNFPEAHNSLGLMLATMGRTSEALVHYQKALELNPDFVEAHNNIGIMLAETGQVDQAMTHFLRALELKPNSADTHYNLCILLANMGRTDEARVHYQKALELNPNLARSP